MNENNKVTTLNLSVNMIADDGVGCLSTALMNENNKVTTLYLSGNDIRDDGVQYLSTALVNENNKLTTLDLSKNNIGSKGARSLSLVLMNKNNKVTTLNINSNNIVPDGLATLLKSMRRSLVIDLQIPKHHWLHREVITALETFSSAFKKYIPRLVCLASVRTLPRIGVQSPRFRELSSDLLIRAVQTLGWYIDLNETIRMLE